MSENRIFWLDQLIQGSYKLQVEPCRSSLTPKCIHTVIEEPKSTHRLGMNCHILLLFPRMIVGGSNSGIKGTKYLPREKQSDLLTRLLVIESINTIRIYCGELFSYVAKIKSAKQFFILFCLNSLEKIQEINQILIENLIDLET